MDFCVQSNKSFPRYLFGRSMKGFIYFKINVRILHYSDTSISGLLQASADANKDSHATARLVLPKGVELQKKYSPSTAIFLKFGTMCAVLKT